MSTTKRIREEAKQRGMVLAEEVVNEAGVSYRQLDYWCRVGLIEYDGGERSGRSRLFEPQEVEVASLLGRVSRLGLLPTSDVARSAAKIARSGNPGVATDGPLSVFVA